MKRLALLAAIVSLSFVGAMCTTSGTIVRPTQLTDAGGGVCGHLSAIGCPQPPTCAQTFDHTSGLDVTWPVACWDDAGTPAQAEACGKIKCPRDAAP